MAFKLPWSNFHELNLDWVLEQIKQLNEKVDAFIGSAVPSDDPPQMDGAASAGIAANYSRGDHVHPTDTSRASQSYAQSIEDKVDDLEDNCDTNFREIYDILNFSTAAPIVDGIANPGNSQYPARADHVHPTDTSRASQTQVDSIQATLDAWAGSANPYGLTPEMDGAGSAGIIDAYSRGDHVHPSDTSKFDKSGGTITGDTTIEGSLIQKKNVVRGFTDAIGWRRVANVPNLDGTALIMTVQRRDTNNYSESHRISFVINNGALFFNETSKSSAQIIDKIRYTDAGKLDIHVDQVDGSYIAVYLEQYAPGETEAKAVAVESSITLVADAPAGETVLASYDFQSNTEPLDVIAEEVSQSGITINANSGYNLQINAAKTGWKAIGIIGITGVNLSDLFVWSYRIDEGDIVNIRFTNTTATNKTYVTIKVMVLYRKDVIV